MTDFDMTDAQILEWINGIHNEPAKASLRHYLAIRSALESSAPVKGETEGWRPIAEAPKDRRILIKTVTFAWSSDICQHVATGDKWVEARWGKGMSGKETWLEWCGDDKTHTTDSLMPIGWAALPASPEQGETDV